jgi:hypothetical protein
MTAFAGVGSNGTVFHTKIARSDRAIRNALIARDYCLPGDIFVGCVQVLRWNPVFRMERAPDLLNAELTQVVRPLRIPDHVDR